MYCACFRVPSSPIFIIFGGGECTKKYSSKITIIKNAKKTMDMTNLKLTGRKVHMYDVNINTSDTNTLTHNQCVFPQIK